MFKKLAVMALLLATAHNAFALPVWMRSLQVAAHNELISKEPQNKYGMDRKKVDVAKYKLPEFKPKKNFSEQQSEQQKILSRIVSAEYAYRNAESRGYVDRANFWKEHIDYLKEHADFLKEDALWWEEHAHLLKA